MGALGASRVPCDSTMPCLNTKRPATPGRPLAARGRVLDWRPQLRLSSLHGGDWKHAEIGYRNRAIRSTRTSSDSCSATSTRGTRRTSSLATIATGHTCRRPPGCPSNPRDTADGHRLPATLRRQFRTGTWVQASLHFHAYPAQFQPACSAPIRSSTPALGHHASPGHALSPSGHRGIESGDRPRAMTLHATSIGRLVIKPS